MLGSWAGERLMHTPAQCFCPNSSSRLRGPEVVSALVSGNGDTAAAGTHFRGLDNVQTLFSAQFISQWCPPGAAALPPQQQKLPMPGLVRNIEKIACQREPFGRANNGGSGGCIQQTGHLLLTQNPRSNYFCNGALRVTGDAISSR